MANVARINPEGIRRYMKGYAAGGDVREQPTFPAISASSTNAPILPPTSQPVLPSVAPESVNPQILTADQQPRVPVRYGFAGGGTVIRDLSKEPPTTIVDLSKQPAPAILPPTEQPTLPVVNPADTNPTILDVRKQPHFPAVRLGFSNAGRIPGKVNPNVADDVTIDAKKGEYVLPIEAVAAMGGADAIDVMVKNIKTKMGVPAEVGPKMRNEPDAQGRMNARGMRGFAGGGDVNPDKMYTGNGPLSKFLQRFRSNPATPEGVPTGYDRSIGIADKIGATLKSWGRAAQPELAGTDTGVWNTDIAGGIKRWDARQRNPDAVTGIHDNLNLPSDIGAPPVVAPSAPPVASTPEPAAMDWTKAGADAIKAVGGFGRQPVGEVTASPEDEANRLAARNAQYAATAADAAGTDAREAFGAKARAAERDINLKDQIAEATRDLAYLSTLPEGNGRTNAAAAKIRLDSLIGQQTLGLKADEISAGVDKENIRGGFSLKEQALRNEGAMAAENIRGGFASKSKELDPSQIAENNARAALLTKQAEGTLSKKEQITLQGLEAKEKARVTAIGHILANQNLDDTQKQSAIAQLSTGEDEVFVPGTAEIPKKKGFLGFGKREAVAATPGRNVRGGNIDLTVAQKLMAKYGNDPAKARAAYAAGER